MKKVLDLVDFEKEYVSFRVMEIVEFVLFIMFEGKV